MGGYEELKSKAFEPVKEFAQFLKEQEDGEPQTQTEYIPQGDNLVEEEVVYFGDFAERYRDSSWQFFEELVNWLLIDGNAHEKEKATVETEDGVWESTENPTEEQLREDYLDELLWLTDHALSYSGGYEIQEEAYEEAFKDTFSYTFDFPKKTRYLIPLINFQGPDETIELEEGLEFFEDRYKGLSVSIDRPTKKEYAALEGSDLEPNYLNKWHQPWTHVIRIEIEGPVGMEENVIGNIIITSLRLLKPTVSSCHLGPSAHLEYGPLFYRKNLFHVTGFGLQKYKPTGSREEYHLSGGAVEEYKEFLGRYGKYLIDGKRHPFFSHRHDLISRPLGRFNDMYRNGTYGDKIIDGVIAFESTLLKDLGTQSSITFRLGLRASLLLENEVNQTRDYIREFFKNLYFARGRVVHHDDSIKDVIENSRFKQLHDGEIAPSKFVEETRYFLANTLLSYMDRDLDDGMNITQTNHKLDDIVRSVPNDKFGKEENH